MGRPPCCDRSNVKRGPWTPEEDAKLLAYVANHGIGNWTLVPRKAGVVIVSESSRVLLLGRPCLMEVTETGLNRCGKSCRLRWTNYLRPDLKHDSFTPQEEELIVGYHKAIGSRWSVIAQHLPGRTDNDVKNYWNTKLKKKLVKMGIDPVTHKPFSQILSDFGNVGRISTSGLPFGSFTRNLNTNLIPEEEPSCFMVEPAGSNIVSIEQVQDNSLNMDRALWDFHSPFLLSHVPAQPYFFNEIASSCCSSSSSPASLTQLDSQPSYQQAQHPLQGQRTPSSPVMWSDYLIADPIFFMEPEANDAFLSTRSSTLMQDDHLSDFDNADRKGHLHYLKDEKDGLLSSGSAPAIGNLPKYNQAGASQASIASSFVDSILDKDTEIRSQFPEILDPSFGFHEY